MEKFWERKAERKNKRTEKTWHLEDSTGENTFEGQMEGGQTANYVLLMMEGKDFTVYQVNEWFNFNATKNYHTLSLEEAEAQLHSRNTKVDRWMMEKYHTHTRKEENIKIEKEEEGGEEKEEPEKFVAFGGSESEEDKEKPDKTFESKLISTNDEEGEPVEEVEERGEEPDFDKMISDDDEELPEGEEEAEEKKTICR